jgi:uncharacterized damage-inducible protein DinB
MRDIFLHLHKSEKGLYYSFSMDLVSDRLFRHLAWANTFVFDRIAEQPEAHLQLTAPNDTWTVAEILEHFTASFYAHLLDSKENIPTEVPTTRAEVLALRDLSLTFDQRLRESAKNQVGFIEYTRRDGSVVRRNRETILTQSIHHATEHRAQIAGIFSNHGLKVIDLDAIDLWRFANHEGLGD